MRTYLVRGKLRQALRHTVIGPMAFVTATSGCMSDAAGPSPTVENDPPPQQIEVDQVQNQLSQIDQLGNSLIELVDLNQVDEVTSLPLTGVTQYNGVLSFSVGTGQIGGQLSIEIDFSEAMVGGTMYNIASSNFGELEGTLTIDNGSVGQSGDFALVADMHGVLHETSGSELAVSAQILGDTYENQEAVAGITVGDVVVGPDRLAIEDGAFLAVTAE